MSAPPQIRRSPAVAAARPQGRSDNSLAQELLNLMSGECRRVQEGDLTSIDSMLISQAHSLDAIFTKLALRSASNMKAGYQSGYHGLSGCQTRGCQ